MLWRGPVLLLLGAWVGLAGAVVHRHTVLVGGIAWPGGLAVVLVTTAVLVHAAGTWRRLGGAWFALGWGAFLMLSQVLPAAGFLVATDALGWAYVGLTTGVIVVVVARASRVES